jgi:hypothetical protein
MLALYWGKMHVLLLTQFFFSGLGTKELARLIVALARHIYAFSVCSEALASCKLEREDIQLRKTIWGKNNFGNWQGFK